MILKNLKDSLAEIEEIYNDLQAQLVAGLEIVSMYRRDSDIIPENSKFQDLIKAKIQETLENTVKVEQQLSGLTKELEVRRADIDLFISEADSKFNPRHFTKLDKNTCLFLSVKKPHKQMSFLEICEAQLFQELLFVPFEDYQKAVEVTLQRPVLTHEFAAGALLQKEFIDKFGNPRDLLKPILEKYRNSSKAKIKYVTKGEI